MRKYITISRKKVSTPYSLEPNVKNKLDSVPLNSPR